MFTTRQVAPERIGHWVAWLFVALMGAAVVASLGLRAGMEPAGAPATAGLIETGLAQGVTALVDVVDSAWRETVRELTKVVMAVLAWNWWPLDITVNGQQLPGGAHVLHS
jgi:hypothetical protein